MDVFYMGLSWICGLLTGIFLTLACTNIKRRMEKEEYLKKESIRKRNLI